MLAVLSSCWAAACCGAAVEVAGWLQAKSILCERAEKVMKDKILSFATSSCLVGGSLCPAQLWLSLLAAEGAQIPLKPPLVVFFLPLGTAAPANTALPRTYMAV